MGDAIYNYKTLKSTSIWTQSFLVLFFYTYLYFETISLSKIYHTSNIINTLHRYETPMRNQTIDDIRIEDVPVWLNTTMSRLFLNSKSVRYIPEHLLYYTVETSKKNRTMSNWDKVPQYLPEQMVEHVRMILTTNYFVGMRVNTVHDALESTSGTLYQNFAKGKKSVFTFSSNSLNQTALGAY